jgi:hypothetical protein
MEDGVAGVPSGVVNIPDIIGYAEQLRKSKKEEQDRLADYLGRFAKKDGLILDGAKQSVQAAYNNVEKAMVEVEMNDNAKSRAALAQAYSSYSELAGAAQAYTQNVQKEVAYAATNPEKVKLNGRNAKDIYTELNSKVLNSDEILSSATQPFLLDRKYEYKASNPYDLAKEVRKDWDESAKWNFIDPVTGKFKEEDRKNWIRSTVNARMQSPDVQRNAAIWSGLSLRSLGENGQITDYSQVEGITDNPNYGNWVNNFTEQAINYTDNLTPEFSVSPYEVRQDRLTRQAQDSTNPFSSKNRGYHAPFTKSVRVKPEGDKDYKAVQLNGYQAQSGIYSGQNQIISFGTWPDGKVWVTYKKDGDSKTAQQAVTGAPSSTGGWGGKMANSQDLASIRQYLIDKNDPTTYNEIFAVSSNQPSQSSQQTADLAALRKELGYAPR